MASIETERLIEWLGGGDDIRAWVERLDGLGEPAGPVVMPEGSELVQTLLRLSVIHEDIDTLLALRPTLEGDPELWWLLERSVETLIQRMGVVDEWVRIPSLPESLGPLHRWFWVYVFVAALPRVRAFHRDRGIPDDISWATLADLGRQMAVYRKRTGRSGFDDPVWMTLHFTGTIYQLGRLQFERVRLGNTLGRAIGAVDPAYGPGSPALSVHIPGYYGPFTPAACDASFAGAVAFFAEYFPDERYEIGVCHSWLLDEQLAGYLPETSNIVRFQRRFHQALTPDANDGSTLRFVFGLETDLPLGDYPQRTTLERATISHIRSGRHWHGGVGWLRL